MLPLYSISSRAYSDAAPRYLGTLLDWLQGEGGLLSGSTVTDARLAFSVGQVRAIMAAAAVAVEAAARGMKGDSGGSGTGGGSGGPEDFLTSLGASAAVVPLLSMVSQLVLEEPSAYQDSGGGDPGVRQGSGDVPLQKHCWWVRAQMAMAAADLFILDAEALNRGGGGQMGGVDEALIQV